MSRTYRIVRFILRSAVDVYFVDIRASGQDLIPADGPLIFAANHPNSIMDTVMLGTQTSRQIRYMARSGLFKNLAVRAIFNHFGVIPVYRSQDGSDTSDNQSSFEKAFEALEEGGCIGIFPEGRNSPDRQVRELKTGTARIALSAEDRNDFSLGVQIQPVGLNFEDRDRFLSRVLIRFGEPIDVRDYEDLYRIDPRDAARALTDRLQKDMRHLATHIEDQRNHQLVQDIHAIYGAKINQEVLGDLNLELDLFDRTARQDQLDRRDHNAAIKAKPRTKLEDRFQLEQRIADAVDFFQRTDPGLVARVRMDVRRYLDHLSQLKIRHKLVEQGLKDGRRRKEAVKLTTYAVLLGPIAIYGLINNVIPALIVRLITRRQPDEAMVAFAGFFTGLLAFPLFYSLQAWALWHLSDYSVLTVLFYVLTLPVTGLFFLRWWRQILAYRERILFRTFFRTEQNLLEALERERQNLIETFESLRGRYLEAQSSQPDPSEITHQTT